MQNAFQISFHEGHGGIYRQAVGVDCRSNVGRRIEGGRNMRKIATRLTGTKFVPRGNSVPDFVSEPANDEFGPEIRAVRRDNNLSRKVIGKIAGVGPETVKAWERGRQKPQWEHLRRIAREVPSVRRWTLRQLGVDEQPQFLSPQVMTAMMAAMHQVSHQPGPDGDAVRAMLAKMGSRT